MTEWRKRTGTPEGDKAPVKPVEDKNGPVITMKIPLKKKKSVEDLFDFTCVGSFGADGGPEKPNEDVPIETPERPAPPSVRQLALAKALELVQSPPDFIEALIAYLQVYVEKEMGGE
ncbi:MAG: hypothetical protein II689_01145 [Firmicutes bacterium]|nr:hypothetical protein [Bacillota bacterium]